MELGLGRITQVLRQLHSPHERMRVLHVAGTNGKGSVCAYLAAVLRAGGERVGRFTSPHLVHPRDAITVNGEVIGAATYAALKEEVAAAGTCTEFEAQTAVALTHFARLECTWCVVEVGVGGRLDATNVVPGARKLCGITKVGLDHQALLGGTLAAVAREKAGVVVPGVRFVAVDGTNAPSVLAEVRAAAAKVGAAVHETGDGAPVQTASWGAVQADALPLAGGYQVHNAGVALALLDHLQQAGEISVSRAALERGLAAVEWPGRLQRAEYDLGGVRVPLLFDGAHNASAAEELAQFLAAQYRGPDGCALVYVLAVTRGKDVDALLAPLLQPHDRVFATSFGDVESMPWVAAMATEDVADAARRYTAHVSAVADPLDALRAAAAARGDGSLVVCGSLYLVGELLRREH
ncbi:AaceriAEL310Cp [[Ashbya] aceris (nom. inval.)]|nr:AaceriAEL310Cp [[Ashbya] aceris (nom. inval.)]